MLILGRRENQSVVITTQSGERIEVMVVRYDAQGVRLGFTADRSVTIHRKEIQDEADAMEAAP